MNVFQNIFDAEQWAAVPFHFWSVVFFTFGCIVGSFLNVVIHRLPLGESVVSPPSHCPHCKYSIPWYLNVPLLTWLYLRGRCRNCGAPIAIRYFLVELLTGTAFVGCWLMFGHRSALLALIYSIVLAGLIAATFIDIEHLIIPDEITIGGAIAGVAASAMVPRLQGQGNWLAGFGLGVLGAVTGAAVIYGIVRMGKLVFGRLRLDLDPDSRIVFGETGLQLPPKRVRLLNPANGSTRFAVHASHVELSDRCLYDVPVGVSASKIVIGTETFERSAIPHLELIVERTFSVGQCARLFGETAGFAEILGSWAASCQRMIRRKRKAIGPAAHVVMTEGAFWVCQDQIFFEEMFYRKSDTVSFNARRVETSFGNWNDVPVRLSPERLQIGEATFNPEAVGRMEVVTDAMTIPREAMGLGDVKFMAAIGAFLGWPAVIFSLAASSLVGATIGVTLIAMGRRDRTARLPFGPYLALGAALWIFLTPELHERWVQNLKLFGQLLSHFVLRTPLPDSMDP